MNPKKSNNILIVKLVFGLALLLFIGWKANNSIGAGQFKEVVFHSGLFLVLAIILMPLNWLLESVKWHLQLNKIEHQKFIRSIKSVLAGISTSLVTPNRIGNFIGRSLSLDKEIRTKAIVSTLHSNLAQFIASVVFGLSGLILLDFEVGFVSVKAIQLSALFIIAVCMSLYFKPKLIDFVPLSKMYSEQMQQAISSIAETSFVFKLQILLLSLFRYLIYLIQFYLLLSCFGGDFDADVIIPAIAVVYLITSIVPSFLFGKLFVREVSAIFVLSLYGVTTPVILVTVFILWLINLALPALFGAIILFKTK